MNDTKIRGDTGNWDGAEEELRKFQPDVFVRGTRKTLETAEGGGILELKPPGKGHWAALVLAR